MSIPFFRGVLPVTLLWIAPPAAASFPELMEQTSSLKGVEAGTSTTIVPVSPVFDDPRASGRALRDALDSIQECECASENNPIVIQLQPGVYDIRDDDRGNSLVMIPWVGIEGSGETATEIRSAGAENIAEATVTTADHTELRRLTITNVGDAVAAIALLIPSGSTTVEHVTARASGGTFVNYGVRLVSPPVQARLLHVTAKASGGSKAYGIVIKNVSEVTLEDVGAESWGAGSENHAIFVLSELGPLAMHVVLEDVKARAGVEGDASSWGLRLKVNGAMEVEARRLIAEARGETSYGVDARGDILTPPIFRVDGSTISSEGASSYGIFNDAVRLVIEDTTVTASGPESYGIFHRGIGEVRLDHSRVAGETSTLVNDQGVVFLVGATRLSGGPVSGLFQCAGAYGRLYDVLGPDCL